jgi:regulator of replication initiation timing
MTSNATASPTDDAPDSAPLTELVATLYETIMEQKEFKKENKELFKQNANLNKEIGLMKKELYNSMKKAEVTTVTYEDVQFESNEKSQIKHNIEELQTAFEEGGDDTFSNYIEAHTIAAPEVRMRKRARDDGGEEAD